jgi:hypothetical protein
MISLALNPPNPPPAVQSDLDRLMTLIQFVTDPKACAARLGEIMAQAGDASEVIANADKVKAEIAADRDALAAERDQHAKQLAADRKAFETQCNLRDQTINARAKETERLNADAKAARDEATRITADLNARLERVKAMSAELGKPT